METTPSRHSKNERAKKLILVIEDDEDAQEMYGRLLWYNNYEVAFASTGAEGIRLASDAAPDLVLLDLRLPDLDGTAVYDRLRAREETARIPVLVLTALPRVDYAEWAERAGCAALLQKPLDPVDVLMAVESVIGPPPASPEPAGGPPDQPGAPPVYPGPA